MSDYSTFSESDLPHKGQGAKRHGINFQTAEFQVKYNINQVFSRESLAADDVVLLFLPMDGTVDTNELAAFGDQLKQRKNSRVNYLLVLQAEQFEVLQYQPVGASSPYSK